MLKITQDSLNTIYPTFTERMQDPSNNILLHFVNEMDNYIISECILESTSNTSPRTSRYDKYQILETPGASGPAQITLKKNGFWEYEAFEILGVDVYSTIEKGRCEVLGTELDIEDVYK